ncbi:hypothetical protein PY257_14880 [Ramlibacter sp. H39-3-26]|nr:hypothetical protein [Ramlibacter sp. H39-3-26]
MSKSQARGAIKFGRMHEKWGMKSPPKRDGFAQKMSRPDNCKQSRPVMG